MPQIALQNVLHIVVLVHNFVGKCLELDGSMDHSELLFTDFYVFQVKTVLTHSAQGIRHSVLF